MARPLEPKGDFSLPAGLDAPAAPSPEPESDGALTPPSEGESHEPFANLKMDERHFEDSKKRDERKAKLVMGEPLGGNSGNNNETVVEGEVLAENEDILADLPDDATDLELTHLRLRTLRGLGLERFTKVQVSSLGLRAFFGRTLCSRTSARADSLSVYLIAHLAPSEPSHLPLLHSSTCRSYIRRPQTVGGGQYRSGDCPYS